jgi:hypothetical protein
MSKLWCHEYHAERIKYSVKEKYFRVDKKILQ